MQHFLTFEYAAIIYENIINGLDNFGNQKNKTSHVKFSIKLYLNPHCELSYTSQVKFNSLFVKKNMTKETCVMGILDDEQDRLVPINLFSKCSPFSNKEPPENF